MRVAAVQMVSSPNVEENLAAAGALIAQAATGGAQLVVLPEYFCLMGNADTDKVAIREADKGPIQAFLSEQASSYGIWLVGGTLPLECSDPGRVYNSTLVFDPEGICRTRYDKIHLFNYRRDETEAYDEAATIMPGSQPAAFDAPCGRVGLSICYDLRFPELYRSLGELNLILVPAAFTYTTGRAHWEVLLRARAIENQCYVLASAQGGEHPNGRRTWGHSMLIDPWGDVLEVLDEGPGVVAGTIDPARIAEVRTSLPALRHRVM